MRRPQKERGRVHNLKGQDGAAGFPEGLAKVIREGGYTDDRFPVQMVFYWKKCRLVLSKFHHWQDFGRSGSHPSWMAWKGSSLEWRH